MEASIVSKVLKLQAYTFLLLLVVSCGAANKTVTPTTNPGDRPAIDTPVIDSSKLDIDIVSKPDSLDLIYPNNKKDTYNIAYALPLFLKDYPKLKRTDKYFSEISLEYWWGSKIAFDTLASIGLSARVNVYDTEKDSARIEEIARKLKKKNTDLLVGPVFPNSVKQLLPLCEEGSMNIVSPLAKIEECSDYGNHTIFSKPSVAIANQSAAQHICDRYDSIHPIFIFCRDVSYEKAEANFFQEVLSEHFESVTLKVIKSNYVDRSQVAKEFPDSSILIITSQRETFVTSVLAEARRSLKDFVVFGNEKWLDFQAIDFQAWERLNMHFVATQNIDYCDELTQDFIKRYRKAYHAEPSKFAIAGFSDAMYYGMHLHLFGTNFQRYFGEVKLELPGGTLRQKQSKECEAFFNSRVYIQRFRNNELVTVK